MTFNITVTFNITELFLLPQKSQQIPNSRKVLKSPKMSLKVTKESHSHALKTYFESRACHFTFF